MHEELLVLELGHPHLHKRNKRCLRSGISQTSLTESGHNKVRLWQQGCTDTGDVIIGVPQSSSNAKVPALLAVSSWGLKKREQWHNVLYASFIDHGIYVLLCTVHCTVSICLVATEALLCCHRSPDLLSSARLCAALRRAMRSTHLGEFCVQPLMTLSSRLT